MLLSLRESKFCAKHVNTCSDDFGALGRAELRVLWLCHMDVGCIHEPGSVKNMALCVLEVEIINVHAFPRLPGQISCILHI